MAAKTEHTAVIITAIGRIIGILAGKTALYVIILLYLLRNILQCNIKPQGFFCTFIVLFIYRKGKPLYNHIISIHPYIDIIMLCGFDISGLVYWNERKRTPGISCSSLFLKTVTGISTSKAKPCKSYR